MDTQTERTATVNKYADMTMDELAALVAAVKADGRKPSGALTKALREKKATSEETESPAEARTASPPPILPLGGSRTSGRTEPRLNDEIESLMAGNPDDVEPFEPQDVAETDSPAGPASGESMRVSVAEEDAVLQVATSSLGEQVLALLREHGPQTDRELSNRTGLSYVWVNRVNRAMAASGVTMRTTSKPFVNSLA